MPKRLIFEPPARGSAGFPSTSSFHKSTEPSVATLVATDIELLRIALWLYVTVPSEFIVS